MLVTHSVLAPYVQKKGIIGVWDSYKDGKSPQLAHRINSVAVCPTLPYKYGLPDGYHVNLYKCSGDRRFRKLSGFSGRVICCNFRNDGKMIIVGEEGGTLRMCTTDKNKFHLRKLKAHQGSVVAASFLYDGLRAASLGSDGKARIWDVTLGSPLGSYSVNVGKEVAHSMVTGRVNNNLLCFGDLNGSVVICDVREPNPVNKISVPKAVSSLSFNKTDKILAVGAGSVVQSWDFSAQKFLDYGTSGGLHLHYKIITGLFIEYHPITDEEILLSVSLDKLVKFTDLQNGKEIYQLQCSSPLTAVAATPKCETLVIGGERGFVKVSHCDPKFNSSISFPSHRQNETILNDADEPYSTLLSEFSKPRKKHRFMFMKMNEWLEVPVTRSRRAPRDWFSSDESNFVSKPLLPLIHQKTEISRSSRVFYAHTLKNASNRVDTLLRRFSHSRALTLALTCWSWMWKIKRRTTNPDPACCLNMTVAVIRELLRRDTLAAAVAGRDNRQVEYIFRFIYNNIWNKNATPVCLELYHCILNTYTSEELIKISGFPKVNRLLELTASNFFTLRRIVDTITNQFHHPGPSKDGHFAEEVPGCSPPDIRKPSECKEVTLAKKRRKTEVE